jgi:hypothetical protein
MDDKHQFIEKPDVVKVTSPVSQTGRGGDSPDLVIKKSLAPKSTKAASSAASTPSFA